MRGVSKLPKARQQSSVLHLVERVIVQRVFRSLYLCNKWTVSEQSMDQRYLGIKGLSRIISGYVANVWILYSFLCWISRRGMWPNFPKISP